MERPTVQSSGLTGRLQFVIPIVATALPETATVTPRPISAETVVTHAPANIWDFASQLGLWAGLIILIPLVLGILLPGPVKFKGKKG